MSAPQFVHFSGFAIILSVVGPAFGNDRTAASVAAALPPEQRSRLVTYLTELGRWNRRANLTAVPDDKLWERHVGESLMLHAEAGIESASDVIDVGSGGGVPGIVIAVVRPDVRVSLLEADARKCGFLTHVAGLLGLRAVRVLNLRAELAGHDRALREQFDVAVARAVAPPPVLCELALPLVRVGGRLAALVADAAAVAARSTRAAELCGGGEPIARGGVLLIPKVAMTPARLPRRPGVPARRPLQ